MNDANARKCFQMMAELPGPVQMRALPYITLFRPGASGERPGARGLTWARVLKLLVELKALIIAGHVQWQQKPARPCPPEAWAEAIDRMAESPPKTLPLKNHNYLRAIAYDIADAMDKEAESARIKAERSGTFREPEGRRSAEPEQIMSVEEMRKIRAQKGLGRRGLS